MDNIDKRVRGYLFQVGYEKWSIAHSTVNRYMVMTSNIAESLNARNREVSPLTDYVYAVMDAEQRRNIIYMQKGNALLDYTHIEAPKYCSAYYTKEYFKKTYEVPVNPLLDETTWDLPTEVLGNVVLPPIVKGKLG
ncbi:uncharacterized protein [Nicotiana tomentosiformis]|uniref:uncharacterized protein n=1 Tax=Nicotiana tomentosiformis TaxID=4098 RepID=UPI00388CB867